MQKLVGPLLERLTTLVFPVLLIALAALALLWQSSNASVGEGKSLPVRAWEEVPADADPTIPEVLSRLAAKAPAATVETYRSTRPFWFSMELAAAVEGRPLVVDFPSRHAIGVACWSGASGARVGEADHRVASGAMSASRAGFALKLPADWAGGSLLCRSQFRGPAKITASLWTPDALTLVGWADTRHLEDETLDESST